MTQRKFRMTAFIESACTHSSERVYSDRFLRQSSNMPESYKAYFFRAPKPSFVRHVGSVGQI